MAGLQDGKEMNQSKFRSSLHFEFVLSSCTVSLSKTAIPPNLYDWQFPGKERRKEM
jgi:hypothetical protein